MATLNDLRTAVTGLLGMPATQGILQLNNNTRERAFEAYVFALVLQAVRDAGGDVELRGINSGVNPNPIVLRGAPGYMGSRTQDFCYAYCVLDNKEFEVHIDVIFVGSSGASHEVDVSIYDHQAAEAVRQSPGMQPTTRSLRAAFECKCYDSSLGTALGRAFVGLVADCGQMRTKDFVTNGQSQSLALYFSKATGPKGYFGISPIIADHAERFVKNVEQVLRQWAGIT